MPCDTDSQATSPENPASPSRLRRGLPLLALALLFVILSPALRVGFLSDDYYLGAEIATVARSSSGSWDQACAAFQHPWSAEFEVFRPLTILSVQLDYALHGPDGRRHHLTNILLWLVIAWLGQAIASALSGRRDPETRSLTILLIGCWPAAIESLGWLVAREDLLVAVFGFAALLLLLRFPRHPLLWSLPLVPAFLSKETAVVLPPLLVVADILVVRPVRRPSGISWLRRYLPAFSILGFYLGARYLLFGSLGTTYAGSSFLELWVGPGAPERIASHLVDSLHRLAVPVNELALAEFVSGWTPWVTAILFGAPALGLALTLLAKGRRGDFTRTLTLLAWICAPILLLAPVHAVSPALDVSRVLAIPGAAYALLLALGLHRGGRRAAIAAGALITAAAAAMILNLGAYAAATERAERLLEDLKVIPGGQKAALVGVEISEEPRLLHPELMAKNGIHVLSLGVFRGTRPPFREPGIEVRTLTPSELPRLPEVLGEDRPWIACFDERELCFSLVAPGGTQDGWAASLTPTNGATIRRDTPPRFTVRAPIATWSRADTARVVVAELRGYRIEARLDLTPGGDLVTSGDLGGVIVLPERFEIPLTAELLAVVRDSVLLWWVELERDGRHLRRSPYATLYLE